MAQKRICTQFFKNRESVHIRHEDIKDDRIRSMGIQYFPTLATAFGQDCFIAPAFVDDSFDQSQIVWIIVNHQDLSNFSSLIQAIQRLDEILLENRLDQII